MEIHRRLPSRELPTPNDDFVTAPPRKGSDVLPLPLYLTNFFFTFLFAATVYFLLIRWGEKISTSTPLHVVNLSEILSLIGVIASCIYLIGFLGVDFVQSVFLRSSSDDDDGWIPNDDEIDRLYSEIFVQALEKMAQRGQDVHSLIHLQSVAKYLERIGDHATNLAEQVVFMVRGEELRVPPRTTAIGALAFYVSHANPHDYQPTNITFGIMEPPPQHIRDKQKRKLAISERALADLETWKGQGARGEGQTVAAVAQGFSPAKGA